MLLTPKRRPLKIENHQRYSCKKPLLKVASLLSRSFHVSFFCYGFVFRPSIVGDVSGEEKNQSLDFFHHFEETYRM